MSEANPLSIDVKATTSKVSDEDWYGQHQWQCGYERGWDKGYEAGWDNRGEEEKNNWVGLTDEEIEAIYEQEISADIVLLTQAKLKEKNA